MVAENIAVACRDLTKAFGDGRGRVWALRGVDLDIVAGELSLLVGPSGCGKTTLISIIAGILDPTDGSVDVLGRPLDRLSNRRKIRFRAENIGFVFQQYNLLPALTAAENACVPLIIAGMSKRQALAQARRLLEALGIGGRSEALPSQLSGGEQQRVAIARALANRPYLLLADEPTGNLDPRTARGVFDQFLNLVRDEGRAALVATHNLDMATRMDRAVLLHDGRLHDGRSLVLGHQSGEDTAQIPHRPGDGPDSLRLRGES